MSPSESPLVHRPNPRARIGIFGIGLAAYWDQFPGLRDRLAGYQAQVESRLSAFGADVVSCGLVDTPQRAAGAGRELAAANLDLIFCYAGTYATSSQVLPAVQRARVPVVVLNLQPAESLDYENDGAAEWLAHCSTCCVPEISNAFARARIRFRVVSGVLSPDAPSGARAWSEIEQWCRAAAVFNSLRNSRIGFLGHTYPGMLDLYSDFTMVTAQTGAHIEVLEMCDLDACVAAVGDARVQHKLQTVRRVFRLEDCADNDLLWAARVSCGLDDLVGKFALDGLTYYYRGLDGNPYERLAAGLILGNSLLTATGIPASGEGDLKTCLAMMILDRLQAGGSYTEFYAMDFRESFVLMGHDGPGHLAISDRQPVLRGLGLFHGKRGHGVSVEFNVRTGPITILGVTQTAEGRLKLLTASGESIPGPILRIGNTNSRLRFPLCPAEFVEQWCREGPTHHCALGIGDVRPAIAKVADLLDIPVVHVC